MYGETATSREQAMALLQGLMKDPPELRRRAFAGLDVLKSQNGVDPSRLAAVGYCFGGAVVLEMARAARTSSNASSRSIPACRGRLRCRRRTTATIPSAR